MLLMISFSSLYRLNLPPTCTNSLEIHVQRASNQACILVCECASHEWHSCIVDDDLFVCLFCWFTSQSTAMVIMERSVHLTTLFPGHA